MTERVAKRSRTETASGHSVTSLQQLWLKRIQFVFEQVGPPLPSVEVKRREEVLHLRRHLSERYQDFLERNMPSTRTSDANVPREAFNRWLMERINANGMDPLLGGSAPTDSEAQFSLKAAEEGLYHDLCEPFRQESLSLGGNLVSQVQHICSTLANKADAAAERLRATFSGERKAFAEGRRVLATLNAKRGCYVFTLSDGEEIDEEDLEGEELAVFTLSPSALAHLSQAFHVLSYGVCVGLGDLDCP